jgi:hypothetical protein
MKVLHVLARILLRLCSPKRTRATLSAEVLQDFCRAALGGLRQRRDAA